MYKLLLVCLALIAVASAQFYSSPYAYSAGLYRGAGVYGAYPYAAGVYGGYAAPVAYSGYGVNSYLYK